MGQPIHGVRQPVPFRIPASIEFVTPDPVVADVPAIFAISPVSQKKAYQPVPSLTLVTPDVVVTEVPAIFPLIVQQGKSFVVKPNIQFVSSDPTPVFALVGKTYKLFQGRPSTFVVTPDPTPDVPAIFPLTVKQYPAFKVAPQVHFEPVFVLPTQFPSIFPLTNKTYKLYQSQAMVVDITFPDFISTAYTEWRTHYQRGRLTYVRIDHP